MDGLHLSWNFLVLQSWYQSFGDCTKITNYSWHNRHFHVPHFFNSLARSRYLSFFSLSFNFTLWSAGTDKSTIMQVLFFLLIIIRSSRLAEIRWSVCISKSSWILHTGVSWWSFTRMSISESPRASRTLLSILVDLNAVVWMVSIRPPISHSASPLYQAFGDGSRRANYNWY